MCGWRHTMKTSCMTALCGRLANARISACLGSLSLGDSSMCKFSYSMSRSSVWGKSKTRRLCARFTSCISTKCTILCATRTIQMIVSCLWDKAWSIEMVRLMSLTKAWIIYAISTRSQNLTSITTTTPLCPVIAHWVMMAHQMSVQWVPVFLTKAICAIRQKKTRTSTMPSRWRQRKSSKTFKTSRIHLCLTWSIKSKQRWAYLSCLWPTATNQKLMTAFHRRHHISNTWKASSLTLVYWSSSCKGWCRVSPSSQQTSWWEATLDRFPVYLASYLRLRF